MKKVICLISLTLILILLWGCASVPTLTNISTAPESQKLKFAQQNFVYTLAHKQWAGVEEGKGKTIKAFAKPKHDPAALRNVKSVAIVSFDFNIHRAEEAKTRGSSIAAGLARIAEAVEEQKRIKKELEPFQPYVNEMYQILAQSLEKQGYKVVPVEKVKECPYYQQLEFKEAETKAKGAWGGGWKITLQAFDLKQIEAQKVTRPPVALTNSAQAVIKQVTQMQELAKALGVDAVILVDNYSLITFKWGKAKIKFGNAKGQVPGFALDMFSATEPRLIWSAALKGEIGVPSNVKSTTALLVGQYFPPLKDYGPDYIKTYKDLAELAVLKLVADSK